MNEPQTLNHSRWDCKYPVLFIPKYRKRAIYAELLPHLEATPLGRVRGHCIILMTYTNTGLPVESHGSFGDSDGDGDG